MPRIARKNIKTQFLHVMVQGVNKEFIFEKDTQKQQYLKIINEFLPLYNLEIIAYCIMSNHSHFVAYTDNIDELSKFMYKVNSKYARMYNKQNERCGVLFRNRYQIQQINGERHLLNCINYIHNNPVAANMVAECGEYKYSSYNEYKRNNGCAKSKILKKVFGSEFNLLIYFQKENSNIFMDMEPPTKEQIKMYIMEGIKEYKNIYKIDFVEIFSKRYMLKKLISYLKEECGIPYKEIQSFFEISKGCMNRLKV